MGTVTYSAMARTDMVDLWVWIASKSGADAADTITDRIERWLAMLADNPMMGQKELQTGLSARGDVTPFWPTRGRWVTA